MVSSRVWIIIRGIILDIAVCLTCQEESQSWLFSKGLGSWRLRERIRLLTSFIIVHKEVLSLAPFLMQVLRSQILVSSGKWYQVKWFQMVLYPSGNRQSKSNQRGHLTAISMKALMSYPLALRALNSLKEIVLCPLAMLNSLRIMHSMIIRNLPTTLESTTVTIVGNQVDSVNIQIMDKV